MRQYRSVCNEMLDYTTDLIHIIILIVLYNAICVLCSIFY